MFGVNNVVCANRSKTEEQQEQLADAMQTCRILPKRKPCFTIWPEYLPTQPQTCPPDHFAENGHAGAEAPNLEAKYRALLDRYRRLCSWLISTGVSARRM